MPEGPEVEAARSSVEKHCLGSTVVKFVLEEQGGGMREGMVDEKVCLATRDELTATTLSHSLENVSRKGKHFWMQFSSGYSLLFHLGMTGSVAFKGRKVAAYKSFTVSSTWPPKFTKLMLEFSNGERFAFCDPRRLGRIRVLKDPLSSPPVSLLAPDPLLEPLSVDKVSVILSKSTAPIKSALLDQEKVCCGIGNWVADEVLYQGSIHPQTPCNVVASSECSVNNLVRTIDKVLNEAVMANADDKAFPSDWLFHKRWGKGKRKEIPTMPNGDAISFVTVGGRTSAVVLNRQKLVHATSHGLDHTVQSKPKNKKIAKTTKLDTIISLQQEKDSKSSKRKFHNTTERNDNSRQRRCSARLKQEKHS